MSQPEIAGRAPVGVDVEKGKTYCWCACSRPRKQPLCGGSRAGTGFVTGAFTASRDRQDVFLRVQANRLSAAVRRQRNKLV